MTRLCQALIVGGLPQDRIVDVFHDLRERLVLVVVRVDVDDQEILVLALHGLLGGMRQRLRGVVMLKRDVPLLDRSCAICFRIHRFSPDRPLATPIPAKAEIQQLCLRPWVSTLEQRRQLLGLANHLRS